MVTASGKLLSHGSNKYGELGVDSSRVQLDRPEEIKLQPVMSDVASVSCGSKHALSVSRSGEVFAWGLGSDGQLGLGTREVVNAAPQRVPEVSGVSSTAAGGAHSAVLVSGQALMCGRNRDSQLARGNELESPVAIRDRFVPVTALSNRTTRKIALGANHSCFLVD